MGRIKWAICSKADELALEKYEVVFYDLTAEQQTEIWSLAEQAIRDWLGDQADAERERRKYES